MCLISVSPKGTDKYSDFFLKSISNGLGCNGDGSGFAVKYENNIIYISKGFNTSKELIKALKDQNINNKAELIVHNRIGTSGLKNTDNCHPFVVTEITKDILQNNQLITNCPVLAHNGIFGKFADKDSVFSDTFHFVQKFLGLPRVTAILNEDDEQFKYLFKDSFVGYNKLAILFPHKDLLMIGDFTLDQGYYFSSHSYCNTNIRNVGGREEDVTEKTNNFNPRLTSWERFRQKGQNVRKYFTNNEEFEVEDFQDSESPSDAAFKKNNPVQLLSKIGRVRLTELNYQDFMFKAAATTHALEKDKTYFVKSFDIAKMEMQLKIVDEKTIAAGVPVWAIENTCKFLPRVEKATMYMEYKNFMDKLDSNKISISKNFYKKILKKVKEAKRTDIFIKEATGRINVDSLTVFIDQFRHLDRDSKRVVDLQSVKEDAYEREARLIND